MTRFKKESTSQHMPPLNLAPGTVERHKRPPSATVRFATFALSVLGDVFVWGVVAGAILGLVITVIEVARGV